MKLTRIFTVLFAIVLMYSCSDDSLNNQETAQALERQIKSKKINEIDEHSRLEALDLLYAHPEKFGFEKLSSSNVMNSNSNLSDLLKTHHVYTRDLKSSSNNEIVLIAKHASIQKTSINLHYIMESENCICSGVLVPEDPTGQTINDECSDFGNCGIHISIIDYLYAPNWVEYDTELGWVASDQAFFNHNSEYLDEILKNAPEDWVYKLDAPYVHND